METGTVENKLREVWDRLTLLLIACPHEGGKPEFEEISRQEIERLAASIEKRECDE